MSAEVGDFLDHTAPVPHLGRETLRAVAGLAGTLIGAQLLVVNAAAVAQRAGVPQTVIGFTLVALGTSLPELVTAVQAQRRRDADLLVGNLLGSNLFNSVAGGALVGLAGRDGPARLGYPVLAAMVAVSLLTWLVLYRRYRVSRVEAVALLGPPLEARPRTGPVRRRRTRRRPRVGGAGRHPSVGLRRNL